MKIQSTVVLAVTLCLATGLAGAAEYQLPAEGDDVVGNTTVIRTVYEDTLAALAQRFGIGYQELRDANPEVDPWLPGEDTEVTLPTAFVLPRGERTGVIINLPEYRLYFFPPGSGTVMTFPIGIGREGWETPLGRTKVVQRIDNPWWTPPASVRREHRELGDELPAIVPPGPDNPMGSMAIQLGFPSYFIHGTNMPFGVGQRVSHGCIRLYPNDIQAFGTNAVKGTPVRIIDDSFKAGWRQGELYVEAHDAFGQRELTHMVRALVAATGEKEVNIDWTAAETAARAGHGIPVQVGRLKQRPEAQQVVVEPVGGLSRAPTFAVRDRFDQTR
jgi:L,D-transpeptidase ErfK/SrfK